MDRNSCKMKKASPPFRATQLWNEAVRLMQNGMPTRRHFWRMRYYDNCFSGKEAVEWLSSTLMNNPNFGKNVTVDGTRKLLQHFLKTGVFQSVKGSLVFKEHGLFEFVNRTINSPSRKHENSLRFTHNSSLREIDSNVHKNLEQLKRRSHAERCKASSDIASTPGTFSPCIGYNCPKPLPKKRLSWTDFILEKIQKVVPSLDVEMLVNPATIQLDWVMQNICPEFENKRKKTELPFWVFTAITSVTKPQDCRESEYTTYAGFEKDVYTVVRDYLKHRNSPVVPYNLYDLFMDTFVQCHMKDLAMKNGACERDSVENLVLSMSQEQEQNPLVHMSDLTSTVLPPNSCFETAFTSDEPITRIVPQSSVDTICLSSNTVAPSSSNFSQSSSKSPANTIQSCYSINKLTISPTYVPAERHSHKHKNRKNLSNLRRTQSIAHIDKNSKYQTLPLRTTVFEPIGLHQQQSYVNYGLSHSLDDLLYADDDVGLDFEQAMQSVNCLLKASCGPKQRWSYVSSSSTSTDSVLTITSRPPDNLSVLCADSCLWYDDVLETARRAFQYILMLMPPASRTSLCMLLQFIDHLPVQANSSMSKTEMVYDLSAHILSPGPGNRNLHSHHMVLSVIFFLVDNCAFLFQELPQEELLDKPTDEEIPKENKPVSGPKVFCEQVSRHQYEDLGVTSSWQALAELLEQIISDKKMKTKEKKRRLKQFKEAYPHIYKKRFSGSSSNLTNLFHFR